MTGRIRRRLLAVLMGLAIGLTTGVSAQPSPPQDEAITSATPDTIRFLREEAVRDRAFADQQLDRARQYRELEANARRYAQETSDPKNVQSWRDSAVEHDKSARGLEDYARQLRAKADAVEARANRLEAAVKRREEATRPPAPAPSPAPAPTPPPSPSQTAATAEPGPVGYKVADVLGYWETVKGPPVAFAITAQRLSDGRPSMRLAAHTRKRQWQGEFLAVPSGATSPGPIVRLTYTPKPEEMNPEIPDWARRAIAGRLIWRVELTPEGENYDFMFKAKWFAGEVEWDEVSKDPASVTVADEARPHEFELELNHGIAASALEFPSLTVVAKTSFEYDADIQTIDALTMGQLFSPRLTVPATLAKELGASVTVQVKATRTGSSEQVELKARGRGGSGPVTYLPDQDVLITDSCTALGAARRNPSTLSVPWIRQWLAGDNAKDPDLSGYVSTGKAVFWSWLAGDDPGPCLQLSAGVGELIEFRHGENFVAVPLYPSWVQHGIARHGVIKARLRQMLQSVAGGATPGNATVARARLRMLENYEKLIASERLTDLHRFNLGELYFGDSAHAAAIVLKSDGEIHELGQGQRNEQRDASYLNPLMKAYLEGLTGKDLTPQSGRAAESIQWAVAWEETLVRNTLASTSEEVASNAVRAYVENFTFGAFEGYAVASGGGQVWIVATGTDHHGNRVSRWDRLFATVGLASTAVLTVAGAQMQIDEAFRSGMWGSTMGKGLASESTLVAAAGRGVDEAAQGATFSGMPASVPVAEREGMMLKAVADGARREKAVSCAVPRPAPVRTLMEVARLPGDPLDAAFNAAMAAERSRIEGYMRRAWGSTAKIVGQWTDNPILPLQEGPTCQGGAANYLVYKGKGLIRSTNEARRKMIRIMAEQVEEFDMQQGGVSFGRRARQGTRRAGDFTEAPGFKVGFDNLATRDYLRSTGAMVTEILPTENAKVKLRHIWSALQKGFGVKVVVDLAKGGGFTGDALHAVVVDEVIGTVDKAGRTSITAVRVYDSNIGRLIEVSARDFNRLLARDWVDGGIMTLVRFREP